MSNPLDETLETYKLAKAAFKVVRRVLDNRDDPLLSTDFYTRSNEECQNMIEKAEEQIELLVSLSIYATFERTLRDNLASNLSPLKTAPSVPPELATVLHDFLADGSKRWRMDEVEKMFRPPVSDDDIAHAGHIRTCRHLIAHGSTPPSAIPPQIAHQQLTDFLTKAGLI